MKVMPTTRGWRVGASSDLSTDHGKPSWKTLQSPAWALLFTLCLVLGGANAKAPAGMLPIPAGPTFSMVWSLGDLGPYNLPAFDIDKFEVTNREFQQFVNQGG